MAVNSGTINIKGLKLFAHHGVTEEERAKGQNFILDISLRLSFERAALTDNLEYTVDYNEVCELVRDNFSSRTFNLLEAIINYLGRLILRRYPLISSVNISIRKEEAPLSDGVCLNEVGCGGEVKWHDVFISVGSNVGNKQLNIQKALEKIKENEDILLIKSSKFKETAPYGNVEMDDVLNGVILVKTLLFPTELLGVLNNIESFLKRERKFKWGPRTMDLDILFYDDLIVESTELTIPHKDLENRTFVLEPMAEIAPDFIHPKYSKSMAEMLGDLLERSRNLEF